MSLVRIKDTQLVRDIHSKAVLNTDRQALDEYLVKREIAKRNLSEQNVTKDKVSKLSSLLEVSQREAKDYLTLLSNDDYKQILNSYGQNTDTGTPKRNKKQTGKRNKLPV
jgi:hypothetical protein